MQLLIFNQNIRTHLFFPFREKLAISFNWIPRADVVKSEEKGETTISPYNSALGNRLDKELTLTISLVFSAIFTFLFGIFLL